MKPLTKRLQTALDLLPACRLAADIGCDHGIAAEALLCQRKCQKVLACDISAPSLEKAKARLTRAGLAAHAEFFCCDGLAKANEADGALLLGMGGRTIVEILQKGRSLLPQMRGLVAGPAGHAEALYRVLPALGLRVEDERIVWENGRFFPLVLLVPGTQRPLLGAAEELGPVNCQRRDETTLRYAAWLCRVLEKTLRVPGASRTAAHQEEAAGRLACLHAFLEEER
ncbi:MAG: tRNA (adenine(22)-N(1))-methyltransferase [Christensenellales bacterium]